MRVLVLSLPASSTASLAGQQADSVNIYRFIFGVDVPQSAALHALGVAPEAIPLGSAPKPLSTGLVVAFEEGGSATPAVAVDVAPYYLVGGGVRTLQSHRSGSIGGRLMRVLTKTVVSLGVTESPGETGSARLGIGVRATFHDPHDPIAPTRLPEEVAEAFEAAGVPLPGAAEESVRGRGVDLDRIYADARRRIRARSGDAQISGGWGASIRARGGAVESDSLVDTRHMLWVSAQYTASSRYDIVTALQYRDAFGSDDRLWIGGALRRKGAGADFQAGLTFDTADQRLDPGISIDARISDRLGVVAALAARPDPPAFDGSRRIRFGVLLRWFTASDPWP